MWDLGQQENSLQTHPFFLNSQSIVVLTWQCPKEPEEAQLDLMCKMIRAKAPYAPLILVGTHADGQAEKTTSEAMRIAERWVKQGRPPPFQEEYLDALAAFEELEEEKERLSVLMRDSPIAQREALREKLGPIKDAWRQAKPLVERLQQNPERVRVCAYQHIFDEYDIEGFFMVDSRYDTGIRLLRDYLQQCAMRQPFVTDVMPRQYVRLMEVLRSLKQDVCGIDIQSALRAINAVKQAVQRRAAITVQCWCEVGNARYRFNVGMRAIILGQAWIRGKLARKLFQRMLNEYRTFIRRARSISFFTSPGQGFLSGKISSMYVDTSSGRY